MAALTLGPLLSQSWSSFRSSLKLVLIGAVIFGTLIAITQGLLQKDVQRGTGALMEGLGIDPARLEELGRLAEAGDEAALQEMMDGLGGINQELEGMTEEEQAAFVTGKFLGAFGTMVPALSIGALISFLISAIALTYFSILALKDVKDPAVIARQIPGLILPMIGLMIWIFLRSFVWLFVIPAIVLGPRFIASIVYLVRDGKGVMESARLSYGATAGYWGKIWGNGIVLAVVLFVVSLVLGMVVGIIGAVSAPVGAWVMQMVQQGISAFAILFSLRLALTIMENPKSVPVKQ